MKIEYFAEGCDKCPLILIYGDDPVGTSNLRLAIERLVERDDRIAIHEIPCYSSINSCRLYATVGQSDIGIKSFEKENSFECILQKDTWLEIMGLLEPFTKTDRKYYGYSFQYLNESSEIRLLISTDRAW